MDFVRKHKKEITIGAGIVAAAGLIAGAYYFFFKKPAEEEEVDEAELEKLTRSQIIKEITIKRTKDGKLTVPTVKSIYHGVLEWGKDEYAKIVYEHRKSRRAAKTSKEYYEANHKFSESLGKLLESSQADVLKQLDVSNEEFDQAIETYLQEGNREMFIFHMQLPKMMNSTLKHKQYPKGNFKEIARAQIEYLKKNTPELKSLAQYCEDPESELPGLVMCKLHDLIFEKYGLEEEDLNEVLRTGLDIMQDKEVPKLMTELQDEIGKVVHVGERPKGHIPMKGHHGHGHGHGHGGHAHEHVHGENCNH